MPNFIPYRVHEDHRRRGAYDIFPSLPGDANFTKHTADVVPEELHMHKIHTDYFTVAVGRVKFRLIYEDGREEKFFLSEKDHKTLAVPPGVWHMYMAVEPSMMVFYIDHKFDIADEFRKPLAPGGWEDGFEESPKE
jgi:dTDP-4-dehydrorhamnose 3,5-epimerase-like enzyme